MDINHFWIIIIIILLSGLLGGIINYFKNYNKESNSLKLLRSLFFGIGASFLVPLFLKMISSDLLETSKESRLDYLVIAGFCLISGIFSNNFIDSLGKKLLNQIQSLENNINDVRNDLENTTIEEEITEEIKFFKFELDVKEFRTLEVFKDSKYIYRSISGIYRDTPFEKDEIKEYLIKLENNNLVEKVERKSGFRWKISEEGKKYIVYYYNEIDESSS